MTTAADMSAETCEPQLHVFEPPRAIEASDIPDEKVVHAVREALESILSVNYLRGFGHLITDTGTKEEMDTSSPLAILMAMDDHLTLPLSYLATLKPICDTMPSGWNAESSVGLIFLGAKSSRKLVTQHRMPGDVRVGILPHSSSYSRCTLRIQGLNESITAAHVQRAVPQRPLLHFYRLSPEAADVTFEDAQIAKAAFIELQGRPIGECTSVHVKMRVESDKHRPVRRQQIGTHTSYGGNLFPMRKDDLKSPITNKGAVPPPIPPIDAFIETMKLGKTNSNRVPETKNNLHGIFRAPNRMERQRNNGYQSLGMESEFGCMRCDVHTMAMQNQVMMAAAAAAVAAAAAGMCYQPWAASSPMQMNSFGSAGNSYSMCTPSAAIQPPFPVCACGNTGVDSVASKSAFESFPTTKELSTTSADEPEAPLQKNKLQQKTKDSLDLSVSNADLSSFTRLRLRHDPYQGGVLVDSVDESCEQIKSIRLLSPPKFLSKWPIDPSSAVRRSADLKNSLKLLELSDESESSPSSLTPNGTTSITPSDSSDRSTTQRRTYAAVLRAGRAAPCHAEGS